MGACAGTYWWPSGPAQWAARAGAAAHLHLLFNIAPPNLCSVFSVICGSVAEAGTMIRMTRLYPGSCSLLAKLFRQHVY